MDDRKEGFALVLRFASRIAEALAADMPPRSLPCLHISPPSHITSQAEGALNRTR
jgi:hypothetical protein